LNSGVIQPHLSIDFDLPWVAGRADQRRFRRILITILCATALLGIVIPLVPITEPDRAELEALPPALARIQLTKPEIKLPPPPPPIVEEVVEPPPQEEIVEPVVEKVVAVEPKPVEKPEPKEAPKETPKETVAQAQETAKTAGLLAFADAFADMRDTVDMSALKDTGSIAQGSADAPTLDRSLLTSKKGGRSAGVNVTELSRDTGGVALSGRETTRIEAPPESRGSARDAQRKRVAAANGRDAARERSIEEVRRVFDGNKGAIFAIYNRALRKNPGLQGKVVLELTIDPNGQVKDCKVIDSELTDPAVVAKIVNRVRLFNFGKRDVLVTRINYPVHFLPS